MSRLILTQITIKKERSISSTTWYYLLQPSNVSAPDSTNYGNPPPTYSTTGYSGWSNIEPTYVVGDDRVLYVMVQTLYSDGTFSYSTPSISSSYEAAKDAYDEIIQAESVIEQFEELGLKKGYIWDNATYTPASGSIPVYPIGTYIASGILVNGNRSITHSNSNTYGLNTWISTGGINLRYNAINLMKLTTSNLEFYYPSTSSQQKKAISLGTNGTINSLAFYGFNNSNKTMELTNNALTFYDPSNGTTEQAKLNSSGLVLKKGGIESGNLSSGNGYVYLSTEDKTGITINGHMPNTNDPKWRAIIGSNFGVDSSGTLYANNAVISGQITVGSGSNVYTTDDVNPLKIGGRNLHKDSANLGSSWAKDGGSTVADGIATIPLSGSGEHRIYQMPASGYWGIWKANTTYTISLDARADTAGLRLAISPYATSVSIKKYDLTTEWQRYSYTFTSGSSTSTASCSYYAENGSSGNVYIKNPKLEYGNKATDWTPAPEDIDAQIDDIQIGGRNLLSKTKEFTTDNTTGFYMTGHNAPFSSATYNGLAVRSYPSTTLSSGSKVVVQYDVESIAKTQELIKLGETYVCSFWAKGSGKMNLYFYRDPAIASWVASDGTTGTNNDGAKVWTLSSSWERYWIAWTTNASATYTNPKRLLFRHDYSSSTATLQVDLCGIKLEKGNKATDWSPAPEDIDAGISNAAQTATSYLTVINGTTGISVHNANDTNNFVNVNSNGMKVYKGGATDNNVVASFEDTITIGKNNGSQSYMRLNSNALQMIDKEGHSYFDVRDLRDNGEFATVSESFPILADENNPSLPDINTYYVLKGSVAATSNVIGVKINGTSVSNWQASVQPTGMCIKFTSTSGLTVGDIATVSYQTSGSNLKALTFGSRGSSNLYYPGGYSVAMGDEVIAEGDYSFASGYHTKAYGIYSAAMGMETIAGKAGQVAIGEYNERDNDALFVIGNGIADDNRSNLMVVGNKSIRIGNLDTSHLLMDYHSLQMIDREGNSYFEVKDLRNNNGTVTLTVDYISDGTTTAYSISPPADNTNYTVTVDNNSGSGITKYTYGVAFSAAPSAGATITITYTTSSILSKAYTFGLRDSNSKQGALSISEGYLTEASGSTSHAEGNETKAKGHHSHAEGDSTIASGLNCHAEGSNTQANGLDSHAEGCYTIAGGYSHAEGYHTIAGGWGSHAQNYYAVATEAYQTVIGKYNTATRSGTSGNYTYTDVGSYAFIIGNGTGDATANRSNALTVDWNGNIMAQGMAGQIIMYAGSTVPTGWLLCDGTSYLRTDYPELFNALGGTSSPWGLPDSTHFNVPDFRDRFPLGAGSSYTLNANGGYKDAAVITHTHSITSSGGHTHTITAKYSSDATHTGSGIRYQSSGTKTSTNMATIAANTGAHTHTAPAPTGAVAATDRNMPPYRGINFIIATGKTS